MLELPSPEVLPTEALSPATPNLSSDGSATSRPRNVLNILSPPSPSPVVLKKTRMPLGLKSGNRPLVHVDVGKENDALSPFTALPPKLGNRMRGLRSKVVSAVDLDFLSSSAVTKRRKDQFDAARRKLEGTGAAAEQRSDSESDITGVLEAKGEGAGLHQFSKWVAAAAARRHCSLTLTPAQDTQSHDESPSGPPQDWTLYDALDARPMFRVRIRDATPVVYSSSTKSHLRSTARSRSSFTYLHISRITLLLTSPHPYTLSYS